MATATRITKRIVDTLKPGQVIWDSEVKGFGVRCQRKAKVYILKARAGGRQRWISIGAHGSPWTPDQARTEAKRLLGEIAKGRDPAAIRDAEKRNPTVASFVNAFLVEHVEAKRKAKTQASYRDLLERLAVPALGRLRVSDVTHADIERLHYSSRSTPYQANRLVAVLSKMFSWAEKHGHRPHNTNPCRHVERFDEVKRERFLSETELSRLAEILSGVEHSNGENPYVVAAIRLLIFTGARLSEILKLEWAHVDFDHAMLMLPESKTGQRVIYLSAPALEALSTIPRIESNPYVIVGDRPAASLVNLQKPWRRIRKIAGLDDVRLHDLRHSYASIAASGGLSLPMIGKLLGHSQAATTHRYAHLAADPIRAANEAIGARISAAMRGEGNGEVVSLPKRSG